MPRDYAEVGLGNHLLIGCQRLDGMYAANAHSDIKEVQEEDIGWEDTVECGHLEDLSRFSLPHFSKSDRLEDDQSERGSLSISRSAFSSSVKRNTSVSVATQTEVEVAPVQTAMKPPRQPVDSRLRCVGPRCVVSFRARHRWFKRFKVTPDATLRFLVLESLEKINPSGNGCCSVHLALASLAHAARKELATRECLNMEFPEDTWQCRRCRGLNNDDDHICYCGADNGDIPEESATDNPSVPHASSSSPKADDEKDGLTKSVSASSSEYSTHRR